MILAEPKEHPDSFIRFWIGMDFLTYDIFLFIVSSIVMVIGSLLTDPPRPEQVQSITNIVKSSMTPF